MVCALLFPNPPQHHHDHHPPSTTIHPQPHQAVGDELLDSVASDNIPIFAEEEKFNAAVTTAVDRLEAKLQGNAVPGEREREGGLGDRERGLGARARERERESFSGREA